MPGSDRDGPGLRSASRVSSPTEFPVGFPVRQFYRQQRELVAAEAEALGVEARVEVWAAPFVVVGVCDGRGFYLRERTAPTG